ncbi:MAG: hypothetical protein IKU43_01450 [Clostridia bacterium]|nr:hypothetical protein [Clostridia bacterium]
MNDNIKLLNARDFGAKGSVFTSKMTATAGSNVITVENIGDFEVGDEVVVTKCFINFPAKVLFERKDTSPVNPRKWVHNQPIGDRIEFFGYDGSQGSWAVYYLDFDPDAPNVLRWTKDFGRSWTENVKIVDGFADIEMGIRVKIGNFKELEHGCTAAFVCDDKMIAVIERIDGNKVYLSETANMSADGEIMHSDTLAIQKAIDSAVQNKKGVFLPNGRYTLSHSLVIENAGGFTFEGESGVDTVIENKFGHIGIEKEGGSCFVIRNNGYVELKNLFMTGNLGFDDRDMAGCLKMKGGDSVWGFYLMKTNATCLMNNESVYIENCHARRMSAECFYASGIYREISENPDLYRRSIIYSRCSVEDCARNAFNNNDTAENTSILNCRVIDVGGCSWEGASRFVKINGCYFRNCGSIAIGNVRGKRAYLDKLGTGQHIVTDNYFEDGVCYGDAMFKIGSCASQITVQNNSFINFNSNGIWFMGECGNVDTPCENLIVCGNSFDMTAKDGNGKERYAINITAPFATVADNQIFVRGEADSSFTGIQISDDVTRLSIHDNTFAGCGKGIISEYAVGTVGLVSGENTFYRQGVRAGCEGVKPMLIRKMSDNYRGWHIVRISDMTEAEILGFDTETMEFTLGERVNMQVGDKFYIYNPKALPWSIHHNIIDNCANPISLETYSGKRAALDNNITC